MPTLNWIGKEAVINHHHDVPFKTLEQKYTFGAEKSENKIIHGDNLEALKALLPEYEGKIIAYNNPITFLWGEQRVLLFPNSNTLSECNSAKFFHLLTAIALLLT